MKMMAVVAAVAVFGGLVACVAPSAEDATDSTSEALTMAKGKQGTLDVPALTVLDSKSTMAHVRVCAGPSGAPAGFVIQWHAPSSDYPSESCDGSGAAAFNGQSRGVVLAPFECREVVLGNRDASECSAPPMCNGGYSFRTFAKATSKMFRSPFGNEVAYSCGEQSSAPSCDPNDWECYCAPEDPNCY